MTDIYFTVKDVKGTKDAPFQLLVNDEVCFTATSEIKEEKYVRHPRLLLILYSH